jgi:hypothetical protein
MGKKKRGFNRMGMEGDKVFLRLKTKQKRTHIALG